MTASWVSKVHTHCRVCGEKLGKPFLDLGEQPLANALVKPPIALVKVGVVLPDDMRPGQIMAMDPDDFVQVLPEEERRFPLQVILCEQCGLSQLSVVVNPEILYAGYRFRSGQSEAWVKHCEELAGSIGGRAGEALDIAANDGTMMSALADYGWCVDGVDPAPASYGVIKGTWPECSPRLPSKSYDLVIAQNVLGHVDDPISFLKAIKTVLALEGRVVVEVPSAEQMRVTCAFDTIYHEHLSYWTHTSMEWAAYQAGLYVEDIDRIPTHGGSSRYWLEHWSDEECGYPPRIDDGPMVSAAEYAVFAQRVDSSLIALGNIVNGPADPDTYKWLGWGASAKAAVYLNKANEIFHIPAVLPAVIDDCVEKQGMLLPGVHIPIIPCPESLADVDVIWCLSWNNFGGIARKARERGFKGKFLLTNGTPRLEDA